MRQGYRYNITESSPKKQNNTNKNAFYQPFKLFVSGAIGLNESMIVRINIRTMIQQVLVAATILLIAVSSTIDAFQLSNHNLQQFSNVLHTGESSTTASGSSSSSKTTKTTQLPPILQQITNERAEYQMNLGRAMDTLRKDMPYILCKTPDFSIYDDTITVIDPSGVQLTGLDKYKSSIQFLQTFIKFWFHDNYTTIQYRMVYDFCRSSIRISWHVSLVSKFQFVTSPLGGGIRRPLHIDGISYYQMNVDTGKIMEHKIETLIVNNTPITPPYGILSILQQDLANGGNIGMRQPPLPVPQGISAAYSSGQATLLDQIKR